MIPVGAFDRVDGSAGDSDPGSAIRIVSPDFLTPYGHQSVATIGWLIMTQLFKYQYFGCTLHNVTPDPICWSNRIRKTNEAGNWLPG